MTMIVRWAGLVFALVFAGCNDDGSPKDAGADGATDQGSADRSAQDSECQTRRSDPRPDRDSDCAGNEGCTRRVMNWCNSCHCTLCEDERCLEMGCDDSCPFECPEEKPAEGSGCAWAYYEPACTYTHDGVRVPYGTAPADVYWTCVCTEGYWHCTEPLPDGGGGDATGDGAADGPVDAGPGA